MLANTSILITDCCIEQKVIPECMDACTLDFDVENIVARSRCIPEIHKLMYCAAGKINSIDKRLESQKAVYDLGDFVCKMEIAYFQKEKQ